MALTEVGTEILGLLIQDLAEYFYAKYVIFSSTQPERIQREFEFLSGLFDQVGLRTNARKMLSMSCRKFHVPVRMSLEAYERRTTGMGPTFWGRQQQRVEIP